MKRYLYLVSGLFVGLGLVLLVACAVVLSDSDEEGRVATAASTIAALATRPPPAAPAPGGAVDKWSLWSGSTQLRGANIYQRRVYPDLDGSDFFGPGPVGPPYTQADFDALAAMGANYVNISHPGLFGEEPPYALDEGIQASLDNLLALAAQADLFAVITFRTGPGRSEFWAFWGEDTTSDPDGWFNPSYYNNRVWGEQAAQDAWAAMWRYTAQRYKDNPIVAGYDLMCEPNSNEVGSYPLGQALDVWDPDEFYADYGGSLYDWNQFFPDIIAAIRQVDADTPILVGGNAYSAVEWLSYLQPSGDARTVYTVHQYEPMVYTHQEPPDLDNTYPGVFDADWDGQDDQVDKTWLNGLLSPVDDFAAAHGAPLAANEYGPMRWQPGADVFMDDQMDLFEQRGMNYALWLWESSWPPIQDEIDVFNFRHGPDPQNHSDVPSSDLMDVILSYWSRNTVRPSSAVTETSYLPIVVTATGAEVQPLALDKVTYWAYQIQAVGAPGAVDALVASHYDLLVLEPTRTDWSSDDRYFDTRGMVAQLKDSSASDGAHRKLVLAYIDIGEAEDWRWYWTWSTAWDCQGEPPADWPDYILACDPDGWGGNYPVAYWDPAWKDLIIYGQNTGSHPDRDYKSAIDEAIRDGFDGLYLDWVEGYENEAVIVAAQAAGVDPEVEMIAFIAEMRAYAQARNPDFLIVQQNAAELIDGHPELLAVIDAIAQEEVWYGGDATDDWEDPDGYDWEIDPDLTAEYLGYLASYQAAGLPVFNCEYALNFAEAAYANSYAEGFVPYASRRSLSRLTTTPPPDY